MVELLLKHKSINVNEKDPNDNTPLYLAIALNKLEMVGLLLKHKDINIYKKIT